jgi:hypothetical protein
LINIVDGQGPVGVEVTRHIFNRRFGNIGVAEGALGIQCAEQDTAVNAGRFVFRRVMDDR